MKEEDKWLKAFKSRMDNYQEPVSEKIWDSLERELGMKPRPRLFILQKFAVAASVLFAVLLSVGLYFLFIPAGEYAKDIAGTMHVSPVTPTEKPQKEEIASRQAQQPEETIVDTQTLPSPSSTKKQEVSISEKEIKQKEDSGQASELAEKEENTKESGEVKEKEQNLEKKTNQPNSSIDPYKNFAQNTGKEIRFPTSTRTKKWAVNLSMGNNPVDLHTENPGFEGTYDLLASKQQNTTAFDENGSLEGRPSEAPIYKQVALNALKEEATTDIKHNRPLTFGLSFRYKFSERFAIESGLMYTYLSSESKAGSDHNYYYTEDKFHYIGIPVKGSWAFINNKHLTVYLSGGGALEKSVAGQRKTVYTLEGKTEKTEKENVHIKPLQFSLSAAVGLQYNITNNIGLYAEPGVVHYFDDGSGIETIRKKKPTDFNLQLGLRWSY